MDITVEEASAALKSLSKRLPRGCSVETVASAAPWNNTGRRLWLIIDRSGREILRAYTPAELTEKLAQYKAGRCSRDRKVS